MNIYIENCNINNASVHYKIYYCECMILTVMISTLNHDHFLKY